MNKISVKITAMLLSLILLLLSTSILCYANEHPDFEFTLNEDNKYTLTKYNGSGPNVVIPTRYNDILVSEIGALAFDKKTFRSKRCHTVEC